jgi:hypothetical protein
VSDPLNSYTPDMRKNVIMGNGESRKIMFNADKLNEHAKRICEKEKITTGSQYLRSIRPGMGYEQDPSG